MEKVLLKNKMSLYLKIRLAIVITLCISSVVIFYQVASAQNSIFASFSENIYVDIDKSAFYWNFPIYVALLFIISYGLDFLFAFLGKKTKIKLNTILFNEGEFFSYKGSVFDVTISKKEGWVLENNRFVKDSFSFSIEKCSPKTK